MGGGNKRKENDQVRINRPQKTGTGGGSGGGTGGSRDINKICPPAFNVRIEVKRPTPNGMLVVVKENELFVLEELVGKLSAANIVTLTDCAAEGINYIGRVLNEDSKTYARFEQNPKG